MRAIRLHRCLFVAAWCSLLIARGNAAEPQTAAVKAADDPSATASGFTPQKLAVPEGFTVEIAAAPPLVQHPTFATFDDRGRLFVCENAGVNLTAKELEEQLPNSIRLLTDSDGDGRFDHSTVFADRMTFPMGGAWHDGALYVASPPNIWRLKDTTGDGVADERTVIVGRFGYTGNAASIHGCFFGPDGRLYWCDGYHGHEFRDEDGNITSSREGSYIFSCMPDGSDVRRYCGGGMDNPVEVDFTGTGEMLGTVNILYTRPRVDALVHWMEGGAYPHRERVLSEIKVTGDLLGPAHRFGHVAVSGMARYRSGGLNPAWRNNLFVTFFNSGKVVRLEMAREGSTFTAVQREFLSCDSREFHPTDVAEDADGSLLVVDTGGWFYRGCPTSQHARPEIRGAIYRVRRNGTSADPQAWGRDIDWSRQSPDELTKFFDDDRFHVRNLAIAEASARGRAMLPALRQTLERGNQRQRRNAVWALTRIRGNARGSAGEPSAVNGERKPGGYSAEVTAAIRHALGDPDPDVRLTACRSLATWPDAAAREPLQKILAAGTAPLRREAATALGMTGDSRAVPALLDALQHPRNDRTLEHAIIFAMIRLNSPEAVRAGLASDSPTIRRGALIALDQMDAGDLSPPEVVRQIRSSHPPLQQTAAEIFSRHPDWSSHAAEVLEELIASTDRAIASEAIIQRLTGKFAGEPSVAELIGERLNGKDTSQKLRNLLVAALAGTRNLPLHESWVAPLQGMLDSDDPATIRLALSAVEAIGSRRFHDRLAKIGTDESRPTLLRVAALQLQSDPPGSLSEEVFALLMELVREGGPGESLQAAQQLAAASLKTNQLVDLAGALPNAGPSQLRELLRPYQRTSHPTVAAAFLEAMQNARGLNTLTPPEFSDVIKRYPRDLLPQANRLLDRIRQAEAEKIQRLDTLLPLLANGDAARGEQLFFSEKTKCATCHRVGPRGGKIGPDLTRIGSNRAGRDLLESVVFPSATIVRDYEPWSVLTAEGRVLSGLIIRETAETLTIQQQTGDPVQIARDDIEELVPSTVSIMPNGLEKALSETELADVIAWLQSLKGSGAEVPEPGTGR